jgi:hypothetical protein
LGGMMNQAMAAKKGGLGGMLGKALQSKAGKSGMGGMLGKAMAMKKGGGGSMKSQAMSFAKNKAKSKLSSMFKSRFGFQNQYNNRTLCENLEEDEFARFYLIAFTALMGYLLYKATQKKR